MRALAPIRLGISLATLALGVLLSAGAVGQNVLPAELSSQDPMARKRAVEQVGEKKLIMAKGKIALMAKSDPHPDVRRAACQALVSMGAYSQINLLHKISATDPNEAVRAAAFEAARALSAEAGDGTYPVRPTGVGTPTPDPAPTETVSASETEKYKKPELAQEDPALFTRHIAVGFGAMGGYGIAAINLRGRVPTNTKYLPSIGIELGGGWTPSKGYQLIAGPTGGDTFDKDNKWRVISIAGGLLVYLHRMHYIPLRAGWDVGRGLYTLFGYGFEHLNEEGFFSWGVEAGILYQPVIEKNIENLVLDADTQDLWPVIPFVRFSLHFYLA
ncbi:MAG: HEAT repeat domain-containing protein [Myxococcota bacterium]|nr:HEAT repeat domain-containing protein [Myxococcota bacterium]